MRSPPTITRTMSDCPTPHKVGHPSRMQAEQALARAWRTGRNSHLPCRAYHCRCGLWHLTSQPLKGHP